MASTYLTRTNGSAVTAERRTFTISFWLKRSAVGTEHALCSAGNGGGSEEFAIRIRNDDTIEVWHYDGSSFVGRKRTNRVLRDTNAWYHIFCQYDTTESTADDRIKFYINGVRETSFADSVNPTLNDNTSWNVDERHQIGSNSWGNSGNGSSPLDGYMSHFYNVAGSIIDINQFGSTDSTTGEWKINTNPTIASYGTAGFLVLKDGNTATDQSPNSNNFTVGGTLTKTEDCPSNVFATFNPLFLSLPTGGLSNGNTTATTAGADSTWRSAFGNLGATSGKYYMEVKWVSGSHFVSGFASQRTLSTHNFKDLTDVYSGGQYFGIYGTQLYTNGSASGSYTTQASGNIIQLALDMDNKKIYQGINGTWNVGGNPSSGNGISISGDTDEFWTFGISTYSNSGTGEYHANFGNGYFATTAVSSAGTNASGNGIFEYDCPNGYTALSTKGLNL